jgi:hypothetical protein
MIGKANGFDYFYQIVCDTEQQFELQLSSILATFENIIEQCHTYRLAVMKESLRILPPTQKLKGNNPSVSVHKHSTNDLEYDQNLLNQCYNEMVRSLAEQFHQKL